MAQLTGAQIDILESSRKGWFWDPVLTIVVASGMLVYGVHALNEETRLGANWWRLSFWWSKPVADVEDASKAGAAAGQREATPLNTK